MPSNLIETLESRTLPTTTGLAAVYYSQSDFTGVSAARIDTTVNFNWNSSGVAKGIGEHNFSARWTGLVTPKYTQVYTFYVRAADGVRLWIDNRLIINDWTTHSAAVTETGTISLKGSAPGTVRLEYYDASDPASIQFSWSSPSTPEAVVPSGALTPTTNPLLARIDSALGFSGQQLDKTLAAMKGNTTAFPYYTIPNGTWATSDASNWTAGFFSAEMWQMYDRTNDAYWKEQATTWTLPLAPDDKFTDDLTFRIFNSFYPLYEATGNLAYRQIILNAAASRASTYNAAVGAFESVGVASHSGNPKANFGVLMDHTMDLSMMFWAAKQTGNQTWYNDALQTARTIAKYFFRPDGSVYQWGYFDKTTGQFISGENYQGYSDSSAWSRAQAWAIHAFTDVYRWTGAPDMLANAERVANYYIGHLPADKIPYWDFNAPGIPNTYRDTSAAAIAASGLIELGRAETNAAKAAPYENTAAATINSLLSPPYLAQGSTSEGILLHGAWFVPAPIYNGDASLAWGDYYLLQAINEYLAMPGALPGT